MNSEIILTSYKREFESENPQTSLKAFITEEEEATPTGFEVLNSNYVISDSKGSIYLSQRINRIVEFTQFKIFTKNVQNIFINDESLIAIGEDVVNNEVESIIKFLLVKDKKIEEKSQFILELPEIETSFISPDGEFLIIGLEQKFAVVRLEKPKLLFLSDLQENLEFAAFLELTDGQILFSGQPQKNIRVVFVQTFSQEFLLCFNAENNEFKLMNLEELFETSIYRLLTESQNQIIGVEKQNYCEILTVKDPKRIFEAADVSDVQQIVKNVFLQEALAETNIRDLKSFKPGEFLILSDNILQIITSENRLLFSSADFNATYLVAISENGIYSLLNISPEQLEIIDIAPIDASELVDELTASKLFDEALSLALNPTSHIQSYKIAEIRELYAKQLFEKGQFQKSVDLYIQTIGALEPSVVVRQFLQQARTQELVQYLEILHSKEQAVAAHTNLLMSCYAKNGDITRLKKFVRTAEISYIQKEEQPEFEVELAVQNCLQQNMKELAAEISAVLSVDGSAFRLFCEEERFKEAIAYLKCETAEIAGKSIATYGNLIIDTQQGQAFIGDVCNAVQVLCEGKWVGGEYQQLEQLFVSKEEDDEQIQWARLLNQLKPVEMETSQEESKTQQEPGKQENNEFIETKALNIEDFVHLFVEPKNEIFLVKIMNALIGDELAESKNILTPQAVETYFELLIKQLEYKEQKESEKDKQQENKKDEQIKNPPSDVPYIDNISQEFIFSRLQAVSQLQVVFSYDHLLILFQQADLKKCVIFTLQKLQLSQESVKFFAENDQFDQAMDLYRKSTEVVKSELYPDLLTYAATHEEALVLILKELKNENIPPLTVLEILTSANPGLNLNDVFDYLYYKLSQINENSSKLQEKLQQTTLEIKQNERKVADLKQPKEWQRPACAKCGILVDAPAVYVRCGHAYHERCWRALGEKCQCWTTEEGQEAEKMDVEMDGFQTFADLMNGLGCGCFK